MNPVTPASCSGRRSARLPGTAPPQNATSMASWPAAAARLRSSAATVTVGGMLFSGMSTIVVTPPAAAAAVAVANPSHSVRPGSLTCTWLSTSPGSSTWPSGMVTVPSGASPYPVSAVISPSSMSAVAGRSPPGVITRRARIAAARARLGVAAAGSAVAGSHRGGALTAGVAARLAASATGSPPLRPPAPCLPAPGPAPTAPRRPGLRASCAVTCDLLEGHKSPRSR